MNINSIIYYPSHLEIETDTGEKAIVTINAKAIVTINATDELRNLIIEHLSQSLEGEPVQQA